MKIDNKKKISLILLSSFFIVLITCNLWTFGRAWDLNPMIVPAGTEPTLDGIKSDNEGWDSDTACNRTLQLTTGNYPRSTLYAMTANNYLFIMIEIKVTGFDDDTYIKLLMSNSSDEENDDFIDAKLIQNRNLTEADNRTFFMEDQHLDDGDYVNDTSQDFFGAANISGSNNYLYFEFKIPFASINDDNLNDTSIYGGGTTYAIKVQYGVHEEGEDPNEYFSPVLTLQIGLEPEEGDPDINPYDIDIDLVSNIMFIIAGIGFAIIVLSSFQARSKIR